MERARIEHLFQLAQKDRVQQGSRRVAHPRRLPSGRAANKIPAVELPKSLTPSTGDSPCSDRAQSDAIEVGISADNLQAVERGEHVHRIEQLRETLFIEALPVRILVATGKQVHAVCVPAGHLIEKGVQIRP